MRLDKITSSLFSKKFLDMKFRDYTKYEVFEDGKIWSYSSKKFLKPQTVQGGYQQVCLTDNEGKQKNYYLHRVVWESVTGSPIPEGYEINHISEVKTENFFANLQLLSHKENINYGTRNKRASKSRRKQVGAFKDGKLVMVFKSIQEAGRQGFNKGNVCACCRGKLKTYKGFEWRYL